MLFISQVGFSQIVLSWPTERAVFQRDNSGYASVIIAGQVPVVWVSSWQLQYSIDYLERNGTYKSNYLGWTNISSPGLGKVFRTSAYLPTGWFYLTVRIMDNGNFVGSYSVKFGVGEVFIIAGQSNAAGEGSVSYSSVTNHDCINSSAQTYSNKCTGYLPIYPVFGVLNSTSSYIGPSATQPWAYHLFTKAMVDAEYTASGKILPIMFFNTGLSGTSSDDWSVTADDATIDRATNYGINRCGQGGGSGVGIGEPYRSLRNCLNYYGSLFGVRGVIWHQGEADNIGNTSANDYRDNLNNVIQKSRDHFNSNLAWAVSNVSFDGSTTDSNIITGQGNSRSNKSAVDGASSSDSYTGTTYRSTLDGLNVHFTYAGLVELASSYYSNISSLLAKTPVQSNSNYIVPVTITQSGSNKIVDVDFSSMGKSSSDFSCYQWTSGDDYTAATYPLNNCTTGYSSKTVTTDGNWRCYMRDATGNVYMTQKLTIKTNSSIRVAASTTNSKVYPNPSNKSFENTISFEINESSMVKLELVNEKGEIVKILANGMHNNGKYEYPFTLNNKGFRDIETYYYRLTVNDTAETKRIIIQ